MTDVCDDLLTNAYNLRRGFGKIHVSTRFLRKLPKNFRVLVSTVFVKQTNCIYDRTGGLCHPEHLRKVVLAGVVASIADQEQDLPITRIRL